MKYIITTLFCLFVISTYAQDTINIEVETPKIVTKLNYGNTYKYKNVEVKFIKIVSDSRCPKDVQCVWAGKAEVLVSITKNAKYGSVEEIKTVTIPPHANLQNKLNLIFSSEEFSIEGFDLLPYPVSGKKTKPEDFVLQLYVKE